MNGELFVGSHFLPLSLYIGERNDSIVNAGCCSGSGGKRTREMPVGGPDRAYETSGVHFGGGGEGLGKDVRYANEKTGRDGAVVFFLQKPLPLIGSSLDFLTHPPPGSLELNWARTSLPITRQSYMRQKEYITRKISSKRDGGQESVEGEREDHYASEVVLPVQSREMCLWKSCQRPRG